MPHVRRAFAAIVVLLSTTASAQEIRDSLDVSEQPRMELAFALGAAFPQGDFTREVGTGVLGHGRLSIPIVSQNGLSLAASGGASDFTSDDQGVIVDTAGNVTSAQQELDYRSAFAHVGLQWTGSWQTLSLRPRLGISAGAHWIETRSLVRVSGTEVDSLVQSTHQTRPGLRFLLASDWVLRNDIALSFEFQIDNVFRVGQYEVSDGVNPTSVREQNVSYIAFLVGLVVPL